LCISFLSDGTVILHVGPNRKIIEIHKKLLTSISPELNKHVNNDMREGIEGKIHLPEEGEEALTLFAEWAYTRDYGREDKALGFHLEQEDQWQSLHRHLQLCVFADKFNIPTLKRLAESKFHLEIRYVTVEPNNESVAGLVLVIGYACDNLPSSDPVLKFLAQYAAWKLELLREATSFNGLVLTQPDFLKELFMNLSGPETRPSTPQIHTSQAVHTPQAVYSYTPDRVVQFSCDRPLLA